MNPTDDEDDATAHEIRDLMRNVADEPPPPDLTDDELAQHIIEHVDTRPGGATPPEAP